MLRHGALQTSEIRNEILNDLQHASNARFAFVNNVSVETVKPVISSHVNRVTLKLRRFFLDWICSPC